MPLPDPPDPRRTSVVAGTRLDLLDARRWNAVRPEAAEALTLRDVLGLPYLEIATLLDVPACTPPSPGSTWPAGRSGNGSTGE